MNKKSKKKKIFLITLAILLIAGIVLVVLNSKKHPPSQPTPPKTELKLLNTNPSSGKYKLFNPTLGIIFNFDTAIDASSAVITITPFISVEVEQEKTNPNALVIRPTENWEYNINYKISIANGLTSKDETKELKNKIDYEIEFEYPPEDIIQIPPPL